MFVSRSLRMSKRCMRTGLLDCWGYNCWAMPNSQDIKIEHRSMSPEDLLGAVKTIPKCEIYSSHREPLGVGYEAILKWARSDIELAESASDDNDRNRHAVNALMHARRALSCIVDQYLRRDLFVHCFNPPNNAADKSALLVARNLIDSVTQRVLSRAIDRRNEVEHRYELVNTEDVEDIVHKIRYVAEAIGRDHNPYTGFFGLIGCGWSMKGDSTKIN